MEKEDSGHIVFFWRGPGQHFAPFALSPSINDRTPKERLAFENTYFHRLKFVALRAVCAHLAIELRHLSSTYKLETRPSAS